MFITLVGGRKRARGDYRFSAICGKNLIESMIVGNDRKHEKSISRAKRPNGKKIMPS